MKSGEICSALLWRSLWKRVFRGQACGLERVNSEESPLAARLTPNGALKLKPQAAGHGRRREVRPEEFAIVVSVSGETVAEDDGEAGADVEAVAADFGAAHAEDVAGIFAYAVNNEISGVWNATAPNPVRNTEFTKELASTLGRPALFPVPPIALKLAFGEFAQHMIDSARVVPENLTKAGFHFLHPELPEALRDILR